MYKINALVVARKENICYYYRYGNGLVVKGLSRLPVTEEIAGSNPVEPARISSLIRG